MTEYLPVIPEIVLTALTLIIFLVSILIDKKEDVAVLTIVAALIVGIIVPFFTGIAFNGMFISDKLSVYCKIIFMINLALCALLSLNYKKLDSNYHLEYFTLTLLATIGMMLMVSSGDLIVLYLSLELVSLSCYVLTGFLRKDFKSNEAGIKYLLLGTFAAVILLYGITLVYSVTGTTNFKDIAAYITKYGLVNNKLLLMGMLFILVAFAFKVGTAPFHLWAPDVYEGAPTPITAFMSIGPKAAGFIAFGRVFVESFNPAYVTWSYFLVFIAILTVIVGNLIALRQNNIKRMLAYSSVSHAGYMMLGIASGTYAALEATVVYLLIYALMNMGAFAVIIACGLEEIEEYNGFSKENPFLAFLMLIFMFSLTGIPPTAGFIGKLNLFKEVINAGYVLPVIVAIVFSVVSAFYYLRVVKNMYMIDVKDELIKVSPNPSMILALTISSIFIILLGLAPQIIIL